MANKAYSIETLEIRAGIIKELTHRSTDTGTDRDAIGIPKDEELLYRHLIDLQDQMLFRLKDVEPEWREAGDEKQVLPVLS